ncbi:retrotransposon protein [Tanacetum coccineum]
MIGNIRLFTSYKAYDGGHVIFGSKLKGKVIGEGNISHDSIIITNVEHVNGLAFNLISAGQLCDDNCIVSLTKVDYTISKNGKTLAKGYKRNELYTCKLGDNSKQQICLASMVDNSTLWHRRLGHARSQGNANNRTRNEVSTTRVLELLHLNLFGPSPIQSYRVLNKETMRIEESLNVKSLPEPKSSPLIKYGRIIEPVDQDPIRSPSLDSNALEPGYPKNLK